MPRFPTANRATESPTRIIALDEAFIHPKLRDIYPRTM